MLVICLNGDIIEVENTEQILLIKPEWEQYKLNFTKVDNNRTFLLLERKLHVNITKKSNDKMNFYTYTVNLFYKEEGINIPFYTFTFYKYYAMFDHSHKYPQFAFGNDKRFSHWNSFKEMLDGIYYRVCINVYTSEIGKKNIWKTITEHSELIEENLL